MSQEPSKHSTVFSSKTVNNKKLANLTANTETNNGQKTLNTKRHSSKNWRAYWLNFRLQCIISRITTVSQAANTNFIIIIIVIIIIIIIIIITILLTLID